MIHLKSQNKTILSSSLTAAIVLVISFGGCYWVAGEIKKIASSIESQQQLHFLLSNQQSVINALQNDFAKIPPGYENKIDSSLPPISNILPMVDSLESLAKKHSLIASTNFSTPDLSSPIVAGPYNIVPISFSTSIENASLMMLIDYLKDLDRLPYLIDITTVNINSGQGWDNESSVALSGKIYARQ